MWKLAPLKKREPGDDLMSRLMTDYVAKGELNRETAVMNGVIMLQAGRVFERGSPRELIERFGREDMEQVFLDMARGRGRGLDALRKDAAP